MTRDSVIGHQLRSEFFRIISYYLRKNYISDHKATWKQDHSALNFLKALAAVSDLGLKIQEGFSLGTKDSWTPENDFSLVQAFCGHFPHACQNLKVAPEVGWVGGKVWNWHSIKLQVNLPLLGTDMPVPSEAWRQIFQPSCSYISSSMWKQLISMSEQTVFGGDTSASTGWMRWTLVRNNSFPTKNTPVRQMKTI